MTESVSKPGIAVVKQDWGGRSAGAIAGLAVGVGNIGAVLANVDQIRRFLWSQFGLFGLENLYLISAILVVGALLIYFAIAAVIYYVVVRGRGRIAIAYWTLAVLMSPAIAYITFTEFGPSRTASIVDQQIALLEQTTWGQYAPLPHDEGAFRFSLGETSDSPQAWTSAQALAGILSRPGALSTEEAQKVRRTLDYFERVRTRDGWGYLDGDPVGVTEIAGWVVLAEALSLDQRFVDAIWGDDRDAAVTRTFNHLRYLAARQHEEGGWGPISRTADQRHVRTYSTVMAMLALVTAAQQPALADDPRWTYDSSISRGVRWFLLHTETSTDGATGWYPNPSVTRHAGDCLGLTAQTIYVLQLAQRRLPGPIADPAFATARRAFLDQALQGVDGMAAATQVGTRDFNSNCRPHDTDRYLPNASFRVETSTFLWYPWSLAAVSVMRDDSSLTGAERNMARTLELLLAQRIAAATDAAHHDQGLYVAAETLYAANVDRANRE